MADIAHYSFLPWFRQGLNSQIIEKDTLGKPGGTALERANLQVQLTVQADNVDGGGNEQTIAKVIQVVGPGDVLNISDRVLIRVNPAPNINNYEANNLAYIEFYEEDFLWRFTPASPNQGNNRRLRPWLALVVLKNDEYTLKQLPDSLPFISVKKEKLNDVFHNPEETWAWAHVHFNETLEESDVEQLKTRVTNELNADADSALSRLLCPRKLTKSTAYRAFLIPAFETGRRAGLGLDITGVVAQESAWTASAQQESKPRGFDFPVYYQWAFQTSNDGDFESLVTKLKPIVMKPESGMMPMDVQEIGYGMDQKMAIKTMGMEAALRPPSFETIRKNFPEAGQDDQLAVFKQLRTFLNLSPSINHPKEAGGAAATNPFTDAPFSADPMIVPPVYGAWQGLAEDLETGTNWPWLLELNLDFRNRAAAGLGTRVIQKHQEELVNRAWQQVGKVNEANNKINEAFLSKLVNNAIFKKHMLGAKTDKFVQATGAVQHLVWNAAKTATVNQQIHQSAIPDVTRSAAFQKITRPTHLTKNLALNAGLIGKFNQASDSPSAVTAAKLKTAPSAALTLQAATKLVSSAETFYQTNVLNQAKDTFFSLLNTTPVPGNDVNSAKTALQTALNAQNVSAEVKTSVTGLINTMQTYTKDADDEVAVGVQDASYKAMFDNFSGGRSYAKATVRNIASTAPVAVVTSAQDVVEYKDNLQKFGARLGTMPAVQIKQPLSESLTAVRSNLISQLKPDFTIRHRVGNTIRIWDGTRFKPVKELKPVMAYPEFHEPSYEYLEEISQNFILPNVDKLPRNIITLLETNNRFIESFLAGLNHEMARELLWREYPTDQRGSYFRQFWNINDNLFESDPDQKKDIEVMDKWTENLGFHRPAGDKDILVLVVRGDLFKKYPSTMVYAQKAQYNTPDASKPRKLLDPVSPENTKFPLFKAELKPDITLFGFDLTAEIANGNRITTPNGSTAGKNPGWFFVFKERAGQTQFGLDDYTTELGDTTQMPTGNPATWNDLTWEHLVNQKSDLDNFQLNFSKPIAITNANSVKDKYLNEVPGWASNAAEVASILYQDPVLIARHAGEMLNEDLLNL
ncbi:hypothetical protein ACFPMF_22950 [Larkinella bovis]|uniref:Uncharacterized protein n=1 Tax=Larkinella bovis TaxID=683041 RepID=A0ABW0IIA4_9BACT